jgi:hypothetical protein
MLPMRAITMSEHRNYCTVNAAHSRDSDTTYLKASQSKVSSSGNHFEGALEAKCE